eukprot:4796151-Pyramimonas_sp.AAC.1
MADSLTIKCTSIAAKVDIRIWKFNPDTTGGRWTLYTSPKKYSKVVWVMLKDQHYQPLRPKASFTKEVAQQWCEAALPYPDAFTGGGKS